MKNTKEAPEKANKKLAFAIMGINTILIAGIAIYLANKRAEEKKLLNKNK